MGPTPPPSDTTAAIEYIYGALTDLMIEIKQLAVDLGARVGGLERDTPPQVQRKPAEQSGPQDTTTTI